MIAATAGFGGGNFTSSMANISPRSTRSQVGTAIGDCAEHRGRTTGFGKPAW